MRGIQRGQQLRVIVAARSWQEAARLADISVHEARTYGSTTDNPREVEAAMTQPHVALCRPLDDHNAAYRPFDKAR